MTDAQVRSELLARGICPEAVDRADLGPVATVPGVAPYAPPPGLPTAEASSWTIRIPDWHPPSLNRLIDGHWSKGHAIKKTTTAIIALHVRRAGIPKAESMRRVWIHLVMAPGQRRLDRDNVPKAVLDALVHSGALKNDSPKWVTTEPVTFSRGEARATFITIEEG